MNWAAPRGLLRFPKTTVMSVYHDDPKSTKEDKFRTRACVTAPEGRPQTGKVPAKAFGGASRLYVISRIKNGALDETRFMEWQTI